MTERKPIVTEEWLEHEMKKINVTISEKAKAESLKQAFAGIQYARQDVKKERRQSKRVQRVIGAFSLSVVVAALLFFVLNGEQLQNRTPNEPNHATDEPAPAEPSPQPPDPEPSDHIDVDRPETKKIVTYPEGMEEERTYQLLHKPALPFTTYYPVDWDAELSESATATTVRLGPEQSQVGEMEITFFNEGTTERTAKDEFLKWVHQMGSKEELQRETPYPDWSISSAIFIDDEYFYTFSLGRHNDRYFYVRDRYILDAADGWGPIQQLIYDEWRWNDTNEPLEKEED